MIEQGMVVGLREGGVDVRLVPTADCEACGCCRLGTDGSMVLEDVGDRKGARTGDLVEIEMPDGSRLRAAAIGYGVPILLLVAGYLVGAVVGYALGVDPDISGAVGAVVAVAAVVAFFRLKGGIVLAAERYRPQVRAIIRRSR